MTEAEALMPALMCSMGGVPFNKAWLDYWEHRALAAEAQVQRLTASLEDAVAREREECAELIDQNEIMDSSDGNYLRPRSDGNRAGLTYAAAIRSRKEKA